MIIDDTDSMIAPLRPHIDHRCPGAALSIVSPDLWPVFILIVCATFRKMYESKISFVVMTTMSNESFYLSYKRCCPRLCPSHLVQLLGEAPR